MSGTIVLVPTAVSTGGGGNYGVFGVTGAADIPTALGDASDSSYYTWTSGPTYSAIRFDMSDPQDLPDGARVVALQAQVRANRTAAVPAKTTVSYRIHNGNYPNGAIDYVKNWGNAVYTNIKTTSGLWETRVNTNEAITLETLNRLTLEIFGFHTANVRVYQAQINVQYDEAPVATVTGPTGTLGDTASPTVTWDYSDDLQPQVQYQVEIFLGGGSTPPPIYASGIRNGNARSFKIPVALDSGQYVVRVAAAQKWTGSGPAFWSAWSYGSFEIAAQPFPAPQLIANEQHGFVDLKIQHNFNLMSFAEASAEHGASEWQNLNGVRNVSVAASASHGGRKTFAVALSTTGLASVRRDVPYIPCARGVQYRAKSFFLVADGSTSANVSVGLEFFDRNMAPAGSAYIGASVLEEERRWMEPSVTAIAPDDGYIRPYLMWSGGINGEIHYFDDVQLWMMDPTFTDPQYGRGGGLYAQHQTSPTFAKRDWPTAGMNIFNNVDAGWDGLSSQWAADSTILGSAVDNNSSVNALYGTTSVELNQSSTAGNVRALRQKAAKIPVTQGDVFVMAGSMKAAAGLTPWARFARMVLRFYDSNSAWLASGSLGAWDTPAGWTRATEVSAGGVGYTSSQILTTLNDGTTGFKVPAGIVFAEVALEVVGSPATGEKHYFDRLAWYKVSDTCPVSVGWQEGTPDAATNLGRVVVEYREVGGIDPDWHQLAVLEPDPLIPTVGCQDWDIGSGITREYRAHTNRFYDATNINSIDSNIEVKYTEFMGTWLSEVGGPGYQFLYDGDPAKQEVIDDQSILTPIVGRDFPVVESNNNRLRSVQVSLALDGPQEVKAWEYFARLLKPIVMRDSRGRRMRGKIQSATITDEPFGATVQFTLMVAGDQSIREQP
jgi:hypothetical protein